MGDAEADPARICSNVVHAVGRDLAEFLVGEVVHVHASGIAFRPPVAAGVAVVADQLLFLGIHRDHRLAGGLGCNHFGIDILELGVAVGVVRALVGLPVDLPREANLGEQLAHTVGADRVAHGDKRRRQFVEALRHPQQWTHRIAQSRRFDEPPEIIKQRRVTFAQSSRAATFTANVTRGKRRRIEVFQAALDGAARQSRDV
jgi:hypothetical protein